MDVLINWPELNAAQFQPKNIVQRLFDRIYRGVNRTEPNNFFRMTLGIVGDVFVGNP